MFDKSQLMRGTLEGCILKIISMKTTYGYEILEYLKSNGFEELSEGTIYPLLLRLEKEKSITGEMRVSPLGPKRKYFSITPEGQASLSAFESCWHEMDKTVKAILGNGGAQPCVKD